MFVTRTLRRAHRSGSAPGGYDDAKQGIMNTFKVGAAVDGPTAVYQLTLAPPRLGFVGDRRAYCLNTRLALQSDPRAHAVLQQRRRDGTGDGASIPNADLLSGPDCELADVRGRSHRQHAPGACIRTCCMRCSCAVTLLYCAERRRPARAAGEFNKIVQGMVGVLDRIDGIETDRHRRISISRSTSRRAGQNGSLKRLFASDIVAIDAEPHRHTQFLVVSRGSNYVMRVDLDANQHLSIGDPAAVVRFQTGKRRPASCMSSDGSRAHMHTTTSACP